MQIDTPERSPVFYARLAGLMYLLNYLTSVFGAMAPGWISGSGDFTQKAERVLASELLYRTALVSMTVGWILIVFLAFSLYVILRPVNKRLAQLALFLEIGQACIGAVTVMFSFATLWLYTAAPDTATFHPAQLKALVAVTQYTAGTGFQISMMFLSVGSTIFFYLFYKSGFFPRRFAAFSAFASVVLFLVSAGFLLFPEYESRLLIGWAPMGIAEVGTAFWLMIRGIRPRKMLAAK